MSEDDFIIPRNSSSATAVGGTNRPHETPERVHVDRKVLEERQRRKEAIAPQPKAINADKDEPWKYLDWAIGKVFPAFDERMWTLGEVARWIAEPTREAVDGLSMDDERLLEIVCEIQQALASGSAIRDYLKARTRNSTSER